MLRADGLVDAPLRTDAGIFQAAEEILKCLPVTRKGRLFAGRRRLEDRNELGKFGMRESRMPVMDTMKRFVQQSERHQLPEPSTCDDATC